MIEILKLTQNEMKKYLNKILNNNQYETTYGDGFLYAKGEIPVLLVAHMDTVHKQVPKDICVSKNGIIMSPQGIGGDDRCGIYAILELMKKYKCHILFTEDEETGCIGAGKFINTQICQDLKEHINFIIEIDRRGKNDCVFYDCDNRDFVDMVEQYGFVEHYGSCSDISVIAPVLGCAAVNVSSGYYNEHTLNEYININHLNGTINRLKNLIENENENYFKYIQAEGYGYYYNSFYDAQFYDGQWGLFTEVTSGVLISDYDDKYVEISDINGIIIIDDMGHPFALEGGDMAVRIKGFTLYNNNYNHIKFDENTIPFECEINDYYEYDAQDIEDHLGVKWQYITAGVK